MYIRVFDQNKKHHYKSVVYGELIIDWYLHYIVLNPHTHTFDLVETRVRHPKLDQSFTEIIQSDITEFAAYQGAGMLKYKRFCKLNGVPSVNMQEMSGYPDVCENHTFLSDILINKSVPVGRHKITIREFCDRAQWHYVLNQSHADMLLKELAHFHDSSIESIHYSETEETSAATVKFVSSWFGVAELCFEGVQLMKIVPAVGICSREIMDASLIVENESIFWADSHMEKADDAYEGCIIKALSLKWRKL